MVGRVARALGVGFVWFVAGCGSSSSSAPPAGDAGADAAVSGTPFEVWVVEAPAAVRTDTYTPLVGATVAWDPPGGGERAVVQTDAEGHATVYGDFTKGDGVVTVYAKDHAGATVLQASPAVSASFSSVLPNPIGKPPSDAVFLLARRATPTVPVVVKLTGNITNKADPADVVALYPDGAGQGTDAPGGTYAITVPAGRPYSIVGFEYKQDATQPDRGLSTTAVKFFKLDRPAQSTDATFDLDVSQATALPTTTGSATVNIPGGDSGPLGGVTRPFFYTADLDSNIYFGVWTKATLAADKGSFGISFVHVDPPTDRRIVTRALLVNPSDGSASLVQVPGAPTDGMTVDGFPAPMPVTATKVAYTDPIAFDGVPAEATTAQLQLLLGNDVVWVFGNPRKAASVTLPALPDDAHAVLKGSRTGRFVYFMGDSLGLDKPTDTAAPSRGAFSRTFSVSIP